MKTLAEIIFQSDHLTVVHAESNSKTVFVTFNEVQQTASGTYFWGDATFKRMGVSAIGFVSAQKNWYPPMHMAAAIAAALRRIGGRRVITYGFSQGGYGALKFGARLSASLALAFSAQWSINPADVAAFDQRFTPFYNPMLRGGDRIEPGDLCPRNFLFADPAFPEDMAHVSRIKATGQASWIPVPFVRHGTVRVITEGGAGRKLIEHCLNNQEVTAAGLRHLIRDARANSTMYQRGRIVRLFQSGPRHRRFLDTAVSRLPDNPEKAMFLVSGHVAANQPDNARAILASLNDDALLSVDLYRYWALFRAAGLMDCAARLAALLTVRYSTDELARLGWAPSNGQSAIV